MKCGFFYILYFIFNQISGKKRRNVLFVHVRKSYIIMIRKRLSVNSANNNNTNNHFSHQIIEHKKRQIALEIQVLDEDRQSMWRDQTILEQLVSLLLCCEFLFYCLTFVVYYSNWKNFFTCLRELLIHSSAVYHQRLSPIKKLPAPCIFHYSYTRWGGQSIYESKLCSFNSDIHMYPTGLL